MRHARRRLLRARTQAVRGRHAGLRIVLEHCPVAALARAVDNLGLSLVGPTLFQKPITGGGRVAPRADDLAAGACDSVHLPYLLRHCGIERELFAGQRQHPRRRVKPTAGRLALSNKRGVARVRLGFEVTDVRDGSGARIERGAQRGLVGIRKLHGRALVEGPAARRQVRGVRAWAVSVLEEHHVVKTVRPVHVAHSKPRAVPDGGWRRGLTPVAR